MIKIGCFNKKSAVGFLGGFFVLLVCPMVASAQQVSVDAASLMRRLDSIERRLQTLESTRLNSGSGAPIGADAELRLQEVEQENSVLNGSVERLSNSIQVLARRLNDVMKDYDMRLQDLENRPAAAAPVKSGEAAETKEQKKTAVPENLSATELYNQAYAHLSSADYAQAKTWLSAFITRFPSDDLTDNAYYWLGEVYLVENNPTEAVKAFRSGLAAFPKGDKSAANLLKMGVALQQLKKPDLAKASWNKLINDFPRSAEAKKAKELLMSGGK